MKTLAYLAILLLLFGCTTPEKTNLSKQEENTFFSKLPFKKFPDKYTCEGEDISPPISISPPNGSCCLAIYMYDETTPHKFKHWIAWNIPINQTIPEGVNAPSTYNDFGRIGYGGPCPPRGEEHVYVFEIYALKQPLNLTNPTPEKAREEFKKNSIAVSYLKATYSR